MMWENILTEVILSVVGIIFSALGALVTYWISKKIKDDKLKTILNSIHEVVKESVLEVYQTYVEALKDKDMFDKEAQKYALERCLELIKGKLCPEAEEWLKSNVKDIEAYLKSMIEAQIALLKK